MLLNGGKMSCFCNNNCNRPIIINRGTGAIGPAGPVGATGATGADGISSISAIGYADLNDTTATGTATINTFTLLPANTTILSQSPTNNGITINEAGTYEVSASGNLIGLSTNGGITVEVKNNATTLENLTLEIPTASITGNAERENFAFSGIYSLNANDVISLSVTVDAGGNASVTNSQITVKKFEFA